MAVKKLRNLSGFGWDVDNKIVIASDDVWDQYIMVCGMIFCILCVLLCLGSSKC